MQDVKAVHQKLPSAFTNSLEFNLQNTKRGRTLGPAEALT